MSIVVQCPHCETRFNLDADKAGKSMRCPNLDCRKTFVVKSSAKPTEPPPLPPDPSEEAPVARPRKPTTPEKPKVAKPAKPGLQATEFDTELPKQAKMKEVVWSEGTEVPPPPKPKKPAEPTAWETVDDEPPEPPKKAKPAKKPARAAAQEPEPDDLPIVRRRKKKERGPWILIGMLAAVFAVVAFGAIYLMKFQGDNEAILAKQAEDEYKKGDHPAAQKSFEKLAADYPDGENTPKYKFFAELAGLQIAVKSATNRENPEPAVQKVKGIIHTHKGSEFAKHTTGQGRDIYDAGKKVGEDVLAHAKDRVKAYQDDRTKSGEIDRAEKAIATGRELLTQLEPFRAPEDQPLDATRKGFEQVEADIKRERDRTAALTKAAAQLEQVSDANIQAVEAELTAAGFVGEIEAQAMLAGAKERLREMVKFEPDAPPVPPQAAPTNAAATILFVAPIGQTRRPPVTEAADPAPPSVFLVVARGILYALDEDTGSLVWAVRVGADVTDPPAVARVALEDGPTDLAVVTSNAGGKPAVAGYVVRTGQARWYQELPAPAAGPAAVVGTRAFVAVRDPEGSVYEFDLTGGTRKGRIRLGQEAGPGPVVRPGTGLLYVAADSRRVFVLDVGARNDDGTARPPLCVQVIGTGHPAGTLRTPPVMIGPDGDTPGDRWMVLAQADGPTSSRVRAFQLQPIVPSLDGKIPAEIAAPPTVEFPVQGWVWFPPATDGERLGVSTDAGQFRLFGVNQPGNFDRPLFPLPSPTLPAPPEGTAVPGLVLPAEEAAFWVLANGNFQKYRLALLPGRGVEMIPVGQSVSLGVPTQPPQLNGRKNSACLVVRPVNSAGYRAVVMNLGDGEVRWQRQLGVVPAVPPISQEGGLVLAAEDGGLISLPATGAGAPGRTTVSPPNWVIADPPDNATGATAVAASPDGKLIFTVTPIRTIEEGKPVARWLIRRISGGQVVHRGVAASPGEFAGQPAVLGDSLLIPVADGFVYRHAPGTGKSNPDSLTAGPPWSTERRSADAVCLITPTSDTSFLTSDGGRKLSLWDWPKAGRPAQGGGWELPERPAGPGVLLPTANAKDMPRVVFADVNGSVWLYPMDRSGKHSRRWKPGEGLPTGKPTSPLVLQPEGKQLRIAYTVDYRTVVCLDPEEAAPVWVGKADDDAEGVLVGPPRAAGNGQWLVGDLGGRVTLFGKGGERSAPLAIGVPGAVPATGVGSVGAAGVIVPVSDGSAVVLPLPGRAPGPEPKGKE